MRDHHPRPALPPALHRGMTQARLSRRGMLQLSGLAAAGFALSACGIGGQKSEAVDAEDFWAGKEETGHLRFANWPLYMDSERTQLKKFTEATGITVDYKEDVQENASFFGKIQPRLANGDSIGYDMMVLTNGMELAKLIALGYLAPLDHARLPNFAEHAGELYKDPDYDPGNTYTVPYASGITGIAYNPDFVDREITSIADLWDPAFEGKVGMFADPQEIANFGLLRNGVNPAESGMSDWEEAADALREQREAGIVRAYYEQDFIQPLTNGDIWMAMAWSGDIFQQNAEEGTNLQFVVPTEGATLWTDLMMIPVTSEAPVDALELMNFLYRPQIAAGLTEYIGYVPPVPETQRLLRERAEDASGDDREYLEELSASPLVFPSDADYDKLHSYVTLAPEEQEDFNSLFQAVTQS
ncbi:spermidine/putrescine ABC transporter substrate-binding protein [Haloechinothrix sp. YIM 98757]|uniref:Spermidine/putrescine ABC transporter substrate-binding protein n=1 Tax=Haloechinothrix aidingensis TaxID=2752311 RepID=A0A838ABL8_9PSEU|nr:spermidine/putrescine ABC transporter substrate-binding protein [Haloechinothrix aidingensis]MBA0126588.1 spermidine/putrescine ABC transporter substrate-binding protein [Haloechinothrix aidingensis]